MRKSKLSSWIGKWAQFSEKWRQSPLLQRYIWAALYRDPSRYKWRFNLVSPAAGLRALPRVWGVLPRADVNKSVTWWNPSPGLQSEGTNCDFGLGGVVGVGRKKRKEEKESERERGREKWPVSPAHSSSGRNGRLRPFPLTSQNIL